MFLWLKAFHVIFVVCWFAGLFYLPRLFVYHAMSSDSVSLERFSIMESKLFWGIMTPSAILATITGLSLISLNWPYYQQAAWFHFKLAFVLLLWLYHIQCGRFLAQFRRNQNTHTHRYYRWFNEFPVLILVAVVFLVILKP